MRLIRSQIESKTSNLQLVIFHSTLKIVVQGGYEDDQGEEEITKMGRIGLGDAGKLVFRPGHRSEAGAVRSRPRGSGGARRHQREARRGAAMPGKAGSGAGGGRRAVKTPGRVELDPPGLRVRERERTGGLGGLNANS